MAVMRSKIESISVRYSSEFSSRTLPAGTSRVKDGAYIGKAAWVGIGVSRATGSPRCSDDHKPRV